MAADKPQFEGNYCLHTCPYFDRNEDELGTVTCLRENVVLDYYNGTLAECTIAMSRAEADFHFPTGEIA